MTLTGSVVLRLTCCSPTETHDVAARLAPLLVGGDVLLLGGDLGAGKTTFAQGLAGAMGIEEPVTSPTFTLVRSYVAPGGLGLLHADLYRLERFQEVVELALPELLDDDAIAVIEWGQVAAQVLWPDHLDIQIDFGAATDERILVVQAAGSRWASRMPLLVQGLGPEARSGS